MHPRVSLSLSFRVQMFLYRIFGMCPTKIRENGPSAWTPGLIFVSFMHLLITTAQLNVVIQLHDFIFYSRDTFGMLNDTFKYCGVAVAYYTIIIETVFRRSEHVQFWQRVIQIKWDAAKLEHKHSNVLHLTMPRRLLFQFGGTALLVILVELAIVPLMINNQQSLNFWVVYSFSLGLSRLRHLQHNHYVNTLDQELIVLAKELQKVVSYSRFDSISPEMADYIVGRIKWAQWNYSLIYDMSQNINEIFGWSQLANFLHSFVQILADLYWIYWRFYNESHYSFSRKQIVCYENNRLTLFKPLIGYAVCIIPSLGIVVMLFAATNKFQLRV